MMHGLTNLEFSCYVMWVLNLVSYSPRTIRVKVSEKIFEPDIEQGTNIRLQK